VSVRLHPSGEKREWLEGLLERGLWSGSQSQRLAQGRVQFTDNGLEWILRLKNRCKGNEETLVDRRSRQPAFGPLRRI